MSSLIRGQIRTLAGVFPSSSSITRLTLEALSPVPAVAFEGTTMDVPACFSGISATDGAIITISVFMILRYWRYGSQLIEVMSNMNDMDS